MTSDRSHAKVLFRVSDGEGGAHVETLWAEPLGEDLYRLDDSPFFAYAVSWGDTIRAPFDTDEGFPAFERVIAKSGNRTVRVIFDPPIEDGNDSDRWLKELLLRGCSCEQANSSYVAINIPQQIDLWAIREFLIETASFGSTPTRPTTSSSRKASTMCEGLCGFPVMQTAPLL